MSLYALYENQQTPSRRDIDDALAGNLCRCTGYKPIVDAAVQMYRTAPASNQTSSDGQTIKSLQSIQSKKMLAVSAVGKKFFAPREGDELAGLYEQYPAATLLAGGTDVGLWITKQHRELDVIIYTGNVRELGETHISDSHIEIGAGVPLTDAMHTIIEHYPTLEELFVRFASPPIRNAGTLGGNVANGSPIGDSMPALLVLGTSLQLGSASGSRTMALQDFYLGYQQTALQAGEFVEKILIPRPVASERVASYKISKRFDQDISAVCSAYRLELDGGKVAAFAMACGGLAATIKRASKCEAALLGAEWNETSIARAMDALAEDFSPISDMRASSNYRLRATQNMLRRFYLESTGELEQSVYDYGR